MLEQEWHQTGAMPEELQGPTLPDYGAYLWEWYCELVRTSAELSYQEVQAWATLTGKQLRPWEVDVLFQLYGEQVRTHQCQQTSPPSP